MKYRTKTGSEDGSKRLLSGNRFMPHTSRGRLDREIKNERGGTVKFRLLACSMRKDGKVTVRSHEAKSRNLNRNYSAIHVPCSKHI